MTEPGPDGQFLESIAVFGGLKPEVLATIAARIQVSRLPARGEVVAEGALAREMFIVREGQLEVVKKGPKGDEVRLAVLKPGDCVGEMSLIDIQPRSASVRTLGPTTLLTFTSADLAEIFRSQPDAYTLLVLNIAREISRRLRRADELLADMMIAVQEIWAERRSVAARLVDERGLRAKSPIDGRPRPVPPAKRTRPKPKARSGRR